MLCIKKDSVYEQIINKSRFITLLYKVDNVDEVNLYLKESKINYPGATHYTYAYIIDGVSKMSDDGEPSKTAGSPILNVLTRQKLNHVLCIVIRYFGGIKLGAGGLVRAYSSSCSDALLENEIVELQEGYRIRVTCSYEDSQKINYILLNSKIIYKEFSDIVIIEAIVTSEVFMNLKNYSPVVIEKVLIYEVNPILYTLIKK